MKALTAKTLLIFGTALTACAAEVLPWENSDFENDLANWKGGGAMTQILKEAAHSGEKGLRITDESTEASADLVSRTFTVTPGVTYALRYWARNVSGGEHASIYLEYFDENGKQLLSASGSKEEYLPLFPDQGWKKYTFCTRAPENAVLFRIRIHSLRLEKTVADFDDFELSSLTPEEAKSITSTRVMRGSFPALDIERIKAISRMIPETPQGIGAPASDRQAWQKILADDAFVRQTVTRAEKMLDAPIPETTDELYLEFRKNGNRTNFQAVYFRKRDMLNTLALAESLECRGRFLPKLTEVIESILSERTWVLPAHDAKLVTFQGTAIFADLSSSGTAAELAQVDWMLQSRLAPELRQRIRKEVTRRVLEPYRQVIREGFAPHGTPWMTADNNWNAVCTRNVVIAGLIFLPDPMERAEFIAAAEVSMRYFAKGFTADGYCSEGVGYWSYGFGHFMDLNEVLLMETHDKIDLLQQNPRLAKVCEYPKNIIMDDNLSPAFADSNSEEPNPQVLDLIQRNRPAAVRWRVTLPPPSASVIKFAIYAFAKPVKNVPEAPADPVPEARSYFQEAGVLICRMAVPGLGNFSAAVKGGHNGELHNHNDVGSYVIGVAGVPLVLDPGSEVYTKRTFSPQRYESNILNSYGHDVPMAAGKLQSKGTERRAEMLSESFTPERDEILMDLTRAYEVPELKKLTRRFAFDRETPAVTVTDEVEFNTPQAFESAIITKSNFNIVDDTHLEIEEKGSTLKAEIQAEGGIVKLDSETIPNPGRADVTRIRVRFTEPVAHGKITVKYVPQKK